LTQAQSLLQHQEYAAASTRVEQVIRMLGTDGSPQAHELREVANRLAELSRAGAPKPAVPLNREYRSGEPGVIDAVPLSRLPRKPDPATPQEKLQVLEVHVNANGDVDSSRFVANRPSYRNSWWTSTAKTWHFKPATKDGQPVRFVMRIVLDDDAVP